MGNVTLIREGLASLLCHWAGKLDPERPVVLPLPLGGGWRVYVKHQPIANIAPGEVR